MFKFLLHCKGAPIATPPEFTPRAGDEREICMPRASTTGAP
ncbi:hypothetical protein C357_15806 [Citreicella sp. 357]|nr:hypothetical protein C357_15806 [Citreicella sp. 357]